MSLFDSLRQPRWQHNRPDVRLLAVAELSDQDILLELVVNDTDQGVKAAALARIDRTDLLEQLLEMKLAPELIRQAKSQRLAQVIPAGSSPGEITGNETLLEVIRLSEDFDLVESAIRRIDDEKVRLNLAIDHPIARVRLAAAQCIDSPDALAELVQLSRNHDKAVFRHCKNKLEEEHAKQKEAEQQQLGINHALNRISDLAGAVDSPGYELQYRAAINEWRALEPFANEEQRAAFQKNQAICGQRLILLREERADIENNRVQVAAAAESFPQILMELETLDWSPASSESREGVQAISARLDDLESRWRAAHQLSPAPNDLTKPFNTAMKNSRSLASAVLKLVDLGSQVNAAIQEATSADSSNHAILERQIAGIDKLLSRLAWPESAKLPQPEAISRLQDAGNHLKDHLHKLNENQKNLRNRMIELVDALDVAIQQQKPKPADKALARARNVLVSLAPKHRQHFEHQLAPLAAKLREFHDWQNFAIEPKKEKLCQRMEALAGSNDDVEMLAVSIQALQSEWKELGPLPRVREAELWARFKSASDEAWLPCQQLFDQQAEMRKANFAARMKLVEKLREYERRTHWPDQPGEQGEGGQAQPAPDWQKVQKILDTARKEFHAIQPVDPRDNRTSQKAFREICDRIYSHIKAEYERNIALKQNLVDRAVQLADQADLQIAIDTAKRLQTEWKYVGRTPVSVDRKLWKAFRSACDQVFGRLDEQRKAQRAETDAQVKEAEALRDQARAHVKTPDPENPAALARTVSELKASALAIELPPPVQQRIRKDFSELERQAQDLISKARKEAESHSWQELANALQCGSVKAQNSDNSDAEPGLPGLLPAGIDKQALAAFLKRGPDEENEESMRQACIALEVFGEIESPKEDKQARMNYQLKQLTQGLGQSVLQPDEAILEHINDFIALRPTSVFVERFCRNLERIRSR